MGNQESKLKKELEKDLETAKANFSKEENENEKERFSLKIRVLSQRLSQLNKQENMKEELDFHRKLNKNHTGTSTTKKIAELVTLKEQMEKEEKKVHIIEEIQSLDNTN